MLTRILNSFNNYSERIALCVDNEFYTYEELFENVKKTYSRISDLNVHNKYIGIYAKNDIETYSSVIAILLSGNAYVPLSPENPKKRNIQIVDLIEIDFVLTSDFNAIEYLKEKTKIIDIKIIENRFKGFGKIDILSENPAYMMFTSGTTGIPKSVPVSHENLKLFCEAFFKIGFKIDENDKFLQMFELSFDLSIITFLIPMMIGASVYTVSNKGVKYMKVYSVLEEHEITFAVFIPSVISQLRPFFDEIRLKKMRYSLFCGEALYDDIISEWYKCLPNSEIYNIYGPTECTVVCSSYHYSETAGKIKNGIICIGKEMMHSELKIIDENNNFVQDNIKGEICIAGNQIIKGYYGDIEKNNESFFEKNSKKFYRTGDIGIYDKDKDFFYLGRKDNQIKVMGGYRVELSEIESFARQYFENKNVVAISNNQNLGYSDIVLVVEDIFIDKKKIHNYLSEYLPDYMLPREYHFLKSFPLSLNGKIDREKIKKILNYD